MSRERNHTIVRITEIEDLTGPYLTSMKNEEWNALSPDERDAKMRQLLTEHINGETFRFRWSEES